MPPATQYTPPRSPMTSIPIALPLASCQPGPIHSTPDGRAWYGHGDRIDPATGMSREAQLTLTSAPRQGDELWVDAHAISGVAGAPPVTWPTLSELEAGIAECQAALAAAPPDHAQAARARAETALWRASRALEQARIAVSEAAAAAARQQFEEHN